MAGDLVGGGPGIRLRGHHLDAVVPLVALASLDEEQLGFSGQTRALREPSLKKTIFLLPFVNKDFTPPP